jgi:hypothetical protein
VRDEKKIEMKSPLTSEREKKQMLRMRRFGVWNLKKKGEQKKALGIAKSMLVKGYDVAEISELTGLTAQEIENL